MNAAYVKAMAQTGDVLLVHGDSLEQKGIQFATTSPFCHVAMLVRADNGALLVVETLEPDGFRSLTFEDWMQERSGHQVFFGQAPDAVRKGAPAMIDRLKVYQSPKARKYDFSALPLVWLSGITDKEYQTGGEVCSLLVADEWEAAGYQIEGNPSPGSFLYLADTVSLIK